MSRNRDSEKTTLKDVWESPMLFSNELTIGGFIVIVVTMIAILQVYNVTSNIIWEEGYNITVSGQVQYATYEENRFWNYKYTDVEITTYTDMSYDIRFLGHDFEFVQGQSYNIVYTRESALGWHMDMFGRIVSLEEVR